jgi:predicted metal-dependent enzyme (double-stranded beta helix superfamily)
MAIVSFPAAKVGEAEILSELPPEVALREAAKVLTSLVEDTAFREEWIPPLLERAERTGDWYIAYRYDDPDSSCSLQVFVWPPGSETQIHDHSCWGVYCCAVGSVLEERYERLDDGSRQNHARLEKAWQRVWSRGDGVSTVLPYAGGIHRVGNTGLRPALSVHLYGPPSGEVDGRDYDPAQDYVCSRQDDRGK